MASRGAETTVSHPLLLFFGDFRAARFFFSLFFPTGLFPVCFFVSHLLVPGGTEVLPTRATAYSRMFHWCNAIIDSA